MSISPFGPIPHVERILRSREVTEYAHFLEKKDFRVVGDMAKTLVYEQSPWDHLENLNATLTYFLDNAYMHVFYTADIECLMLLHTASHVCFLGEEKDLPIYCNWRRLKKWCKGEVPIEKRKTKRSIP